MEEVRFPAVAGTFYSSDKDSLLSDLATYIKPSNKTNKRIRALIVPHAGYIYSGEVAGEGYAQINGDKYDEVFLLGVSHSSLINGVAVANYKEWETPIEKVLQSKKSDEIVNKHDLFHYDNKPHAFEHSLEVQLPFLQHTIKEFSIIPALIGEGSPRTISQNLVEYIDEDDLLVISTDFSHYLSYDQASEIDKRTIASIINLDTKAFEEEKADACGGKAVAVMIEIAKLKNWNPELIKYANSGDVTGDKSKVVGYAAIMFT